MEFVADRRERLDQLLVRHFPEASRSRLAAHARTGGVRVDGIERKPSYRVEPGEVVSVAPLLDSPPHDLDPVPLPLTVVFEDAHLLVLDKPAGLTVHPAATSKGPTLVQALLAHGVSLSAAGGAFRPGIVHRLDKDTSGLLLVAKSDRVHAALQRAIQERQVDRRYWAWVLGVPRETEFRVESHVGRHPRDRKKQAVLSQSAPGARLAITDCRLVSSGADPSGVTLSLVECKLSTGRTHQIRVHLASVGLPILGDRVYGASSELAPRQALHAYLLTFEHPVTLEAMSFVSPVPKDLEPIASIAPPPGAS